LPVPWLCNAGPLLFLVAIPPLNGDAAFAAFALYGLYAVVANVFAIDCLCTATTVFLYRQETLWQCTNIIIVIIMPRPFLPLLLVLLVLFHQL